MVITLSIVCNLILCCSKDRPDSDYKFKSKGVIHASIVPGYYVQSDKKPIGN